MSKQQFNEELYGMLIDIFRNTGTMPSIPQMDRIRKTCIEIEQLFRKEAAKEVQKQIEKINLAIKEAIKQIYRDIDKIKEIKEGKNDDEEQYH